MYIIYFDHIYLPLLLPITVHFSWFLFSIQLVPLLPSILCFGSLLSFTRVVYRNVFGRLQDTNSLPMATTLKKISPFCLVTLNCCL